MGLGRLVRARAVLFAFLCVGTIAVASRRGEPISWRVIAKDGADLPSAQIVTSPADMFLPVGSTCDVEVTFERTGLPALEISSEILADVAMQPFAVAK